MNSSQGALMAESSASPWWGRFADLSWIMTRHVSGNPSGADGQHVREIVLNSEAVQAATQRYAHDNSQSVKEAKAVASKMLDTMLCDIWPNNLRVCGYILRKVWRQMYEGIFVNKEGVEAVRRLQSNGVPVVLLPTHKSHMDYVVLTYICFAYNLIIPHVVAGDNLKIPLVGSLLRHSGAFFIRRQFGEDDLYKTMFTEYTAAILSQGCSIECFIEGGRSRSGKLLAPRTGFLRVLADLVHTERLQDVMLVPVSISYDKIMEGAAYVNEMLGARKQKETLTDFINAVNHVVRLNFGSIDVHIQEPMSLRAMVRPSCDPLGSAYINRCRHTLTALAYRVLHSCNAAVTTTATTLVATLLLTTPNRGIHTKELVSQVEWLKGEVESRGFRVARLFQSESTPVIVDRALNVLGKLIQKQNSIIFGFKYRESLELCYYRNQILHIFVAEALVSVCVAPAYNLNTGGPPRVCAFHQACACYGSICLTASSQLLKFEFVYNPAQSFEATFSDTISGMQRRGLLQPSADGSGVVLVPSGQRLFLFLCTLVWPFLDVYWVAVSSLFTLQPDLIMEESRLCRVASRRAEALYYSGHLDFYEAVSVDAIKNAFSWCVSQRVLTFKMIEGNKSLWKKPGERLLQLHATYQDQKKGRKTKLTTPTSEATPLAVPTQPPDNDRSRVAPDEQMLVSETGRSQRLISLANRISTFRKRPMSKRDPESLLRHYTDADLSSTKLSPVRSFLLGSSKL